MPGISKNFRRLPLAVIIGSVIAPATAQEPNPMQLPDANRQLPNFAAYDAWNVPSMPAGGSYPDPVTNLKVVKLTDDDFPSDMTNFPQFTPNNNRRGFHDYSEGGPYISREWAGKHTILLHLDHVNAPQDPPYPENFSIWLVDYQRGTGAISRPRLLPVQAMPAGLAWSFSNDPNEPQMAYAVRDDTNQLIKINTATSPMQIVDYFDFPAGGTPKWLQVSEGDDRIAFVNYYDNGPDTIYVLDSNLEKTHELVVGSGTGPNNDQAFELDEIALDRGDNYVLLRRRDDYLEPAGCPQDQPNRPLATEEVWYLWNLTGGTNGSLSCRGGVGLAAAHTGWVQGYFAAHDSNSKQSPNFYYNPVSGIATPTGDYASDKFLLGNHYAAQWIQSATDNSQWYFGSNVEEGEVAPHAWSNYDGTPYPGSSNVYYTVVNWDAEPRLFMKDTIGVRAVYQSDTNIDPRRFIRTLTAASSENQMTEGSFYFNSSNRRVYVWPQGNVVPNGRIKLAAPGPVHNGIGVRRINGDADRLVAHTYSWPNDADRYPIATVSPDGKLVMFASTMGIDNPGTNERTDVFVVEMPTGSSPPPPPPPPPPPSGGGTPVVWVNYQYVDIDANTITENCACGTARAESQQTLASGDGFVEFLAGSDHAMFAMGLGDGPPSSDAAELEYSLRFYGTGVVEVRESGQYRTDNTYTEGQRFRVAIEDGDVNYYKYNGTTPVLIYSSETSGTVQYPVKVEAALLGAGTSVAQAVVGGNGSGGGGGGGDITWTNLSNATTDGNTIIESGNVGNSGGQSTQSLAGDGFMEFTAVEINQMRAVGLDAVHINNTFQDIDFAIVLRQASSGSTAVAEVWQNGTYVTDTTYTANTRFRIAIENGVIRYYKYVNGTMTAIPAGNTTVTNLPVRVDAALYGPQSTIADVVLVPE